MATAICKIIRQVKAVQVSVLFSLIFFGCATTGKYFQGDGFNNQTLKLYKDHRFSYQYFQDVGGTTRIAGVWSKKRGVLILNGDNKPLFKPNSVTTDYKKSLPKKLIVIQNMDVPAGKAVVLLNGNIIDTANYIPVDEHSYDSSLGFDFSGLYTDIETIKSVKVLKFLDCQDCGLTQNEFQIQDSLSNFIRIITRPYNQYFEMKFFYNTEWLLRGNKIYYWRHENNTFDKKRYLRKVN